MSLRFAAVSSLRSASPKYPQLARHYNVMSACPGWARSFTCHGNREERNHGYLNLSRRRVGAPGKKEVPSTMTVD